MSTIELSGRLCECGEGMVVRSPFRLWLGEKPLSAHLPSPGACDVGYITLGEEDVLLFHDWGNVRITIEFGKGD